MKKTFSIPSISCNHCLNSVKRELGFVDGIDYIDGNVDAKTVLVEYSDESALGSAREMLAEAGYAPSN